MNESIIYGNKMFEATGLASPRLPRSPSLPRIKIKSPKTNKTTTTTKKKWFKSFPMQPLNILGGFCYFALFPEYKLRNFVWNLYSLLSSEKIMFWSARHFRKNDSNFLHSWPSGQFYYCVTFAELKFAGFPMKLNV